MQFFLLVLLDQKGEKEKGEKEKKKEKRGEKERKRTNGLVYLFLFCAFDTKSCCSVTRSQLVDLQLKASLFFIHKLSHALSIFTVREFPPKNQKIDFCICIESSYQAEFNERI